MSEFNESYGINKERELNRVVRKFEMNSTLEMYDRLYLSDFIVVQEGYKALSFKWKWISK